MWLALFALAAVLPAAHPQSSAVGELSAGYNRRTGQVTLTSGRLQLLIETQPGLNPRVLRDRTTGRLYADSNYVWPEGKFPKLVVEPRIQPEPDGGYSVILQGRLGSLLIEQRFTASAGRPGALFETITLTNLTDQPVPNANFKCGFAKILNRNERWMPEATALRFNPVPYRRETHGELMDFPLREVTKHGMPYAGWAEKPVATPTWGAEGWVWSDGASSFVIAKYISGGMEWSLMEPVRRSATTIVRFGGAGQWKHGIPAGATQIEPGKSFRFGETLLQAVDGDWKQGYSAYRHYTESRGNRPHDGYNPPVHWNELYDNDYFSKAGALDWFKPDTVPPPLLVNGQLLKELYTLDDMKAEADKAKELGCEALYLDPGWDTGPSHHIWDADRLGTMDSFVKMLREEYGLKLSLWIGLAGVPPTYADPDACPVEARVINKDGERADLQCIPSPAFLKTKTNRLLELCRHGAAFLMFDSTQYTGPCYAKTHGHSIPSTREEHARALVELAQRVKRQCPRLLIEMHDPVSGPSGIHYTPTYYGYAEPNSFDCLWGHEFMWNSMKDLLEGRALSLYYYNLAYSIPLYLHIGLRTDNANALAFWWYASTVRHLGVGGKSPDPSVWAAHKQAMRTYLVLKRFYTQGVFYGLDETVHAHTLPDLRESVIDCFNLGDTPVEKQIRFRLADIGLPSGKIDVEGAPFTVNGDEISIRVHLPARGHESVKVRLASDQ